METTRRGRGQCRTLTGYGRTRDRGAVRRLWLVAFGVLGLGAAITTHADDEVPPLGLPRSMDAGGGPNGQALASLGKKLFFDPALSADGTVSCSSCHQPDKAFTDGRAIAEGVGKLKGSRNAPSLLNAGYHESQFWDGRRRTLDAQVLDPLFNLREHGLTGPSDLTERILANPGYRVEFSRLFPGEATVEARQVATALATYVRTLVSGRSPADRYLYSGDSAALTASQIRGLELFRGRAQCADCHLVGESSALYTDHKYHNHSVGFDRLASKLAELARRVALLSAPERDRLVIADPEVAALGRYVVTLDPRDIGRFKTPSLRNVALTAPYMHDGSIATMDEAVTHEVYYRGRAQGRPLVLTPGERQDLVNFLNALNGDQPLH